VWYTPHKNNAIYLSKRRNVFPFRKELYVTAHGDFPLPETQVGGVVAPQYERQDKQREYQRLSHDLGPSAYNLLDGINQNLFNGKGRLHIEKNTYDKTSEPHKEFVISLSWRETRIHIHVSGETCTAFMVLNINKTYGPEKVLELGDILPSWVRWLENAQDQFSIQCLSLLTPLV